MMEDERRREKGREVEQIRNGRKKERKKKKKECRKVT
jgi:hypothetical protein